MKRLLKNWLARTFMARHVVDAILRQPELGGGFIPSNRVRAIRAYRFLFEPLSSLDEAVEFVDKRKTILGL